ncbi:conserved Plasmodium protein, unknown function [Plasmodium berghei]|uniref:RAP domain-containing protein n=2 Tax=Plasmodium berghei TaxID=5821 RepID=A0A509AF79_PLABA|nr:conserved Plasmodium protein, unknown function [Plasmodium berghei ANKA]CXH88250.1 conserved Plasmodium protein, unknown function [Plasmodium berghei]SCL90166.1 conserved Plasmodium protein, unknown function [Plasmodium berghei]SCM15235.1 conserved Plasmodium protein, unknown function [Plasmodium berghei]SCM17030.1 conserved Plasmodium protein, unknown function [Plasmodium berghei]SCN21887.1 conserved Plasmodium protein, unknown function [Plasmodium berghei]|eukprot:XP_034419811.1 conserved Plasmodium protein, unknown function [Plasmodium berghei ANKA]
MKKININNYLKNTKLLKYHVKIKETIIGKIPYLCRYYNGYNRKENNNLNLLHEHIFYDGSGKGKPKVSNKKSKDDQLILKSKIINLINGVKNVDDKIESIKNDRNNKLVCQNFVDIIFILQKNVDVLFGLKEKYVIGFIWSFSKIINYFEKTTYIERNVILNFKYLFIHIVNLIIKQGNILSKKNNDIDIRQFLFSILSIKFDDTNIKDIQHFKFLNYNHFYNYIRYIVNLDYANKSGQDQIYINDSIPFKLLENEKESSISIEAHVQHSTNKFIKKNINFSTKKQNEYNNPNMMQHSMSSNLLYIFECNIFKTNFLNVQKFIINKLNEIPLDIKIIINFFELCQKNMCVEIKKSFNHILLNKFKEQNYISNFSIFELCRYINILVNYNVQIFNNNVIPFIISTIMYDQIYFVNNQVCNYNLILLGNNVSLYDNNSINQHMKNKKYEHLSEINSNSYSKWNTWLYDGTKRDISSLIRDFSRMKIINKNLYYFLIECFFFKINYTKNIDTNINSYGAEQIYIHNKTKQNCINNLSDKKGNHIAYSHFSGKNNNIDNNIDNNINYNANKKSDHSYHTEDCNHRNGEKYEMKTFEETQRNDNLLISNFKKEKGNKKIYVPNLNDSNEKKNNIFYSPNICTFNINHDMRNAVDILISLANVNYYYDKFIDFFIYEIIKKEKNNFFFFNTKNMSNVILVVRSLLILGYNDLTIFDTLLNFIIENNKCIEIKQIIMIYYSIYCYIVKAHEKRGIKYYGNDNFLFYTFSSDSSKKYNLHNDKFDDFVKEENVESQYTEYNEAAITSTISASNKVIEPPVELSILKKECFNYLYKFTDIIFSRKEEIDSMQGLSNFLFALSNSINNISKKDYDYFYKKFWSIFKLKGQQYIHLEAIVQIFLSHYRNNIFHQNLMIYLLNVLISSINVDIHNLSTILYISYHFNIIKKPLFDFTIHKLFKEIKSIEQMKTVKLENINNLGDIDMVQITTQHNIDTPPKLGNNINNRYCNICKGKGSDQVNFGEQSYNNAESCLIEGWQFRNVPNNFSNECNKDLEKTLLKCVWSLSLCNWFLESHLITFLKMCILLKKIFKYKKFLKDEEYNMIYQISLSLNLYYKKNKRIFVLNKNKITTNIPITFFIPFNIIKESIRRKFTLGSKQTNISSFQYKISSYFNKKKIMHKSEYSLKHGLIVDFLVFKNDNPYLLIEIDGIYHYNISNDPSKYEIIYNDMPLLKNGKTIFRNNVLNILYNYKFVEIPWFSLLQSRSIKKLEKYIQ